MEVALFRSPVDGLLETFAQNMHGKNKIIDGLVEILSSASGRIPFSTVCNSAISMFNGK